MDGLPVTVRLLDPPLHEFLPRVDELEIKQATEGLHARRGGPPRGGSVVARVQPDARHSRRAPRRREAGSLRHAGAGADGGRRRARRRRRQADRRDHDPAHRHPRGARPGPLVGRGRDRRGDEGPQEEAQGHHRHDDRDAPRGDPRRRDRRGGRLLLVRHERPHADDVRLQPRRRREPDDADLPRGGAAEAQPVRDDRRRRRRRARAPRSRARPQDEARPQARRVRRARRRPRVDRALLRRRSRLRELLAVSGCRSPGSRQPRPCSVRVAATRDSW